MSRNRDTQASIISNDALNHQDGLLDIFLGLGLLLAGLGFLSGLYWMAGVYPAMMVPLWQSARKANLKRMGIAHYGISGQNRMRYVMIIALFVGSLFLFLLLGAYTFFEYDQIPTYIFEMLREYFPLLIAIVGAVLFGISGIILKTMRLLSYAAITLFVGFVSYWFALNLAIVICTLGLIIFISGSLIFIRFRREYSE